MEDFEQEIKEQLRSHRDNILKSFSFGEHMTEDKIEKANQKKTNIYAKKIKEELNRSHMIPTMWQLEDRLKREGKIFKGQALVFFCPVYFHGQKIVTYLLERFDEHGEKLLFPLPIITDEIRIKIGLKQMESLGISNPKQYLKKKDKAPNKDKIGLVTYSTLPGIEGVHNNKYEFIANEFVQLGAFQIVPNEWVNQGDPVNETYRFPGEDGYSPYWRIPTFEEFKKLRPDLAKGYKKTSEGIVKVFKK